MCGAEWFTAYSATLINMNQHLHHMHVASSYKHEQKMEKIHGTEGTLE
jgi:hypothetical protein